MFSEAPPAISAFKKPGFQTGFKLSLRWGSSSFHIVGAETRKLCGPTRTVHGTITSRRSARSLTVFTDAHTSRKNGLDIDHWCSQCHQRNLKHEVSGTVGVMSTSSRWMNVGCGLRAEHLRGERAAWAPQFLNGNFWEVGVLQTFMANIRRRQWQHTCWALRPSRRRTRQVSRRWCQLRPLSRDKTSENNCQS